MMRAVLVLWLVLECSKGVRAARNARQATSARYTFYRSMGPPRGWGSPTTGETRRVFGGQSAELATYPPTCVLLDRYWTARCSGAVVAPRWALTAAHCVSPHIAYVKYNSRHPASPEGDVATVHYLYRHPGYKVVQEDEGRGIDVTLLNHDVGLVRTRRDMVLAKEPLLEPLRAMRLYNPMDLKQEDVEVLGFGRTERSSLGEELFSVRLRMVQCDRASWLHCMCAVAETSTPGLRSARGVCSGDSGGPVLYHGAQIGVTSMGPTECSAERIDPPEGATSVFTALYNYADLVNATIADTEAALRMQRINNASCISVYYIVLLLTPLVVLVMPVR